MDCEEVAIKTAIRLIRRNWKGSSVVIHLYVEDCDAMYKRAVEAGATASMPLMDAFWGDRYGQVTDSVGQRWGIATHKQDLTPAEVQKGAGESFKNMPASG